MVDRRIRVLIVDDSSFVRMVIKAALAGRPEFEVVGVANDGVEGLKAISRLRPDVVTLDVEMPRMNGIQVLERAAGKVPVSFLMVSTLTQAGARITFDALERGAFDYVSKPTKGISTKTEFREELYEKIIGAYRAKGRKPVARTTRSSSSAPSLPPSQAKGWVVAIGVSCGGPPTLARMLPAFPSDFPPILITQHMPPEFTQSFAHYLDGLCAMHVREAVHGDVPSPGTVLVAPGHSHLKLVRHGINLSVRLDDGPKVSGHRPSADAMFESVARTCGPRAVGVILTGMGNDGAAGLQRMSQAGGWTIAQDEETSVVYGMPKAAMATGCIDHQVPLEKIPLTIARLMQKGQRVTAGV